MKIKVEKNTAGGVQHLRLAAQLLFILLSIWIGIEFTFFVVSLENPLASPAGRPAGVEAYLPISALMSFVYFLHTGVIHPVHPTGFFLFIAFIVVSFVLGKSFCSWICPVGTLSEYVGSFGETLFRKKITVPAWADYPLRSLKYLLLAFFLWSILSMTAYELLIFLDSDYNKIADVKLFDFFRSMSRFSVVVLTSLLILSIPIRNFWCRYLCPYGALFGIFSILSPLKITRVADSCINCDKCDKVCPSNIKVSRAVRVVSDECTSCLQCIDACPVNRTLVLQNISTKKNVSKKRILAFIAILYLMILGFGVISGRWHSNVSHTEAKELYQRREMIGH